MALNLDERYPGRANGKTLSYPQGSFKNRTSPTSADGTYLEADWANDWAAFFQLLIQEAGMTANGQVDTAEASQYFDALMQNIRAASIPFYATTPGSNVGPIIYVIDRQQILLWQTIGTFTGYASAEVGDFRWGTSISAKPGTVHAIGQTIDRSLPQYAALIAWATVNGHMVASGSWVKGAFHFSALTGNNVRLPDLRDQFIRATGSDAGTANARQVGSWQKGSLQSYDPDNVVKSATGISSTGSPVSAPPSYHGLDIANPVLYPQTLGVATDAGTSTYSISVGGFGVVRPPNVAMHPTIYL